MLRSSPQRIAVLTMETIIILRLEHKETTTFELSKGCIFPKYADRPTFYYLQKARESSMKSVRCSAVLRHRPDAPQRSTTGNISRFFQKACFLSRASDVRLKLYQILKDKNNLRLFSGSRQKFLKNIEAGPYL